MSGAKQIATKLRTPNQIVCDVCGELIDEDKYKRHIRNGHKDKREFRCEICGKEFTSNYNLQYHVAHHLNERNFICNECPRAYNTNSDLVQHQRIHEKLREPYHCKSCNLYFEIKSRFNTHMRIHKTVTKGPKICTICNKTVLDVKRHHETVHLNVRNHECDFCPKKFNKKSGLERHILTVHEKQKNFVCDICNAAFGEKSLMQRHARRHSIIKTSFYCTICKKYVGEIKDHYNTVHTNLPHSCEFCYRRFLKVREWKNHVMTRHTKSRKWLCDLCGKGFVEMYQLKRHFRTHINVDFVTEEDVEKLIENLENSKPTRRASGVHCCKVCRRSFKRKLTLDRHTKARHGNDVKLVSPAICDYCGQSFRRFSTLETHLKLHIKPNNEAVSESEHGDTAFDYDCSSVDEHKEEAMILPEIQIETITIKKEPEYGDYDDNDPHPYFDGLSQSDNLEIKNESETDVDTRANEVEEEEEVDSVQSRNRPQTRGLKQRAEGDSDKKAQSNECTECDRTFASKKSLRVHLKRAHQQQLECAECSKKFSSKSELEEHIEKCHSDDAATRDQFMCNYCGKILMSDRNLKLHVQAIHNNLRFECTVCSKPFTYKSAMYRHRDREHGKGKVYQCDKCSQKVGTKHELALHNERHHNSMRVCAKPEHMCTQCGICFPSSFVLSRHERRIHSINGDFDDQHECGICHENFKDYYWKTKHFAQVHQNGKILMRRCQYCSSEFKLYEDFKNHIETHVGIFICTVCGEPFYDLQALTVHGATHKKIEKELRRHICDYCGHRLFTKVQLQQHMLKHIKNFDIHYCDVCGKGFKFSSSLYTHRKYHGEGEFVCTYCGRKFARNCDLVSHIRSHTNEKPFKCQVCGKEFAQKQALYYHHQIHPETRASSNCTDCKMAFPDKKQLKIHEEQVHPERRPFRCFACNMTFKHEHNLRRHNTDKHFKIRN